MNRPRELFVPARITNVETYDPGEVRKVALTLPETFEVDGRLIPVCDRMRPGGAFLVKPFGVRTQKYRRRMYTRSNCSDESPRVLETIINDTHKEKADTSPWWQTDDLLQRCRTGGSIDVCVNYDETRSELVVYQNSQAVDPTTLVLEEDHEWRSYADCGGGAFDGHYAVFGVCPAYEIQSVRSNGRGAFQPHCERQEAESVDGTSGFAGSVAGISATLFVSSRY